MQPNEVVVRARPLIERMASTLWPILREAVTPITVIQGERSIQWGTGTFFRVAEESFLVTACHVWDEAVRCGFDHDLFIFDLGSRVEEGVSLRPVALSGTIHRVKDPPDVAVIELDTKVVAQLSACRFLRLSEVGLRPMQMGPCWVFGYPLESTEDIPARSLFRFSQFFMLAPFYQRPVSLENYEPRLHFLLDVARDDLWQPDGNPGEMPYRLNGVSGCSIWQPEWPKDNSPDSWDPGRTRIVGVQTSYYPKPSVIKATAWGAIASVLYQVRPDLRSVIELNLGPP